MEVKVRKHNADGVVRLETHVAIKEILINENLISPKAESVSLCFRGKDTSGIITLSTSEIEFLASKVRPNLHLIKDSKVFVSPRD